MRVVLDTNVLVSALLTQNGLPARILEAVYDGSLTLVLSEPLLQELQEVLQYPKIRRRLDARSIDAMRFVELLRFFATLVDTKPIGAPAVRDPDDRKFLAVLIGGLADWLVSGDQDLLALAADYPILTPAAFVARFLP